MWENVLLRHFQVISRPPLPHNPLLLFKIAMQVLY